MSRREWVDMPRLIELREQGKEVATIAETLGVSYETVRTILGYVDRSDVQAHRPKEPLKKCA